jgi:hypothetical protein
MLLDISGNSFTALGNILPTVTYNPKQLYGNDLFVWVDLTDWKNMYNSSGGTTNIPSTGCVPATSATDPSNHTSIRRMEDMAGTFTGSNLSRKFYPSVGPGSPSAPGPYLADSATTGTTANLFFNNQWDTNKGIISGSAGNAQNLHHWLNMNQPINFLATKSAVTICSFCFIPTSMGPVNYNIGMGINQYLSILYFGFRAEANSNTASFYSQTSGTTGNLIFSSNTIMSKYGGRIGMLTGVISGNTYFVYVNNDLIGSGTISSNMRYPISGNSSVAIGASTYGFTALHNISRPYYEAFIANAYTSPEQINLLYDYFRIKFKDRIGDLV